MSLKPVTVNNSATSTPVPQDAPAPTRTQTGAVDGGPAVFFKAVGKKMAQAFKSIGEGIASLAPKTKPSSESLSPGSKAAFAEYRDIAKKIDKLEGKVTLTQTDKATLTQLKADLKEARKDAVQHLKAQFQNGTLMQEAQNEPNKTILASKKFPSDDPVMTLNDGLSYVLANPAKIDTILKSGMKIDEAVAIFIYSQGAFSGINSELRGGNPSPFIQELADKATSGLERLPPFTEPVYRIVSLPASVDQQYRVGNTVADRGLLSSTFNVDFDIFGGGTSHVLSIIPSEKSPGRDISWLSESPTEKEVLFPPGTEFVVRSRDQDKLPKVIGYQPDVDNTPIYDSTVGLLLAIKS